MGRPAYFSYRRGAGQPLPASLGHTLRCSRPGARRTHRRDENLRVVAKMRHLPVSGFPLARVAAAESQRPDLVPAANSIDRGRQDRQALLALLLLDAYWFERSWVRVPSSALSFSQSPRTTGVLFRNTMRFPFEPQHRSTERYARADSYSPALPFRAAIGVPST
jgi:hypothetical protein